MGNCTCRVSRDHDVMTYMTIPATISGGPSIFQVRIGSGEVLSAGDEADFLVAFYQHSYQDHLDFLREVYSLNPKLKDDMEGVGLYDLGGDRGYLIVSSQGNNSYAVYRREGDNAFVGLFHIVADPERGIDGVSETDGLDVVSGPLGARFPDGLLVAQDGRNLSPRERQNYKFVSWRDIAGALGIK